MKPSGISKISNQINNNYVQVSKAEFGYECDYKTRILKYLKRI